MALNWVSVSGDTIPPGAFCAGHDIDGTPFYIGRASHDGDLLPGKFSPSKRTAYVCYNYDEIPKNQCEVLTGTGFSWIAGSNGNVPPQAVRGGQTKDGEPLYIGRAPHMNSLIPGKIHGTHGCLYFPYGGVEHNTKQYEVLCTGGTSQWVQSSANGCFPECAHIGGNDVDGSPIYIGRANHENDLIPGKIIKQHAYVAWNLIEHCKENYEVLCHGNLHWIKTDDGQIPCNAVPGGRVGTGEILYIGRANYMGSLTVGKVHPSHKTLYIPFSGTEVAFASYEILVEN